jgi:hypothetical protein
MNGTSPHKYGTPTITRVIERLEQKGCPQGLHVILEELRWMGERSTSYEKLWHAVRTELRAAQPRIRRVAEGVYWFSEADIPLGWSLFGDRRMLPCFYRKYPPAISWDDLDLPENILPPPHKPRRVEKPALRELLPRKSGWR